LVASFCSSLLQFSRSPKKNSFREDFSGFFSTDLAIPEFVGVPSVLSVHGEIDSSSKVQVKMSDGTDAQQKHDGTTYAYVRELISMLLKRNTF
jgi:hypothetical protein